MVFITIVIGAYKPTYNWGPHIVGSKTTSVVKPMINLPWLGMAITTHLQWFFFGMVDCWVYHFSTLIPLIVPLSHLFIKSIVLLIALYIYICMVLKCIKYYLSRYFWYVYVCPYILLKKKHMNGLVIHPSHPMSWWLNPSIDVGFIRIILKNCPN